MFLESEQTNCVTDEIDGVDEPCHSDSCDGTTFLREAGK